MLLDRSVLGEETLEVLKISNAPSNFMKCLLKRRPSQKRNGKSLREIPKGYRKAAGKFLKGIGKPLGNS
jgi:hypothetical protein